MTAKNAPRPQRQAQGNSFITALILAVSAVLIAVGVFLSEPAEVLQKAVNICLECIGIG